MMEGIKYLIDDQSNRVAVQIDLKKYGEIWEDFYGGILAEERKNEEKISLDLIIEELKGSGKLIENV